MRKKHRPGEIDAMYFENLPQRAKELFFEYLSVSTRLKGLKGGAFFMESCGFNISRECESPIEQLFDFAWQIHCFEKDGKCDSPYIELSHQHNIQTNKGKYRADFYFDSDYPSGETSHHRGKNNLKLVIECDGHDFHEKTKEQVAKNNKRNLDLQMAGYEILHFSGSQVFENPLKCVKEVYEYIQKKVGGWVLKEPGD